MKKNFTKIHIWINTIGICILLVSLIVVATIKLINSLDSCSSDYKQELEVKYWHTKSELVDEVQEFIRVNAPGSDLSAMTVVNACDEYNVDLKFVLVQGLMESHFGTKGLAAKTNCVWNVGACDGYSYKKISKKWKFSHPDQSVRPYLEYLTDRYLSDGRSEMDLLVEFVDIDGNRYASYKKYEKELLAKYNRLSGTKLDSLVSALNKQKLRLNR